MILRVGFNTLELFYSDSCIGSRRDSHFEGGVGVDAVKEPAAVAGNEAGNLLSFFNPVDIIENSPERFMHGRSNCYIPTQTR